MQFFKGLDDGFYLVIATIVLLVFLSSIAAIITYPIKEEVMAKQGYKQEIVTVTTTTTEQRIIWVKIEE